MNYCMEDRSATESREFLVLLPPYFIARILPKEVDMNLCECGCGQETSWNERHKRWNKFIYHHHHRCRSEETKKRLSESHKGQIAWNRGKKLSPLSVEHRNKISQGNKGKVISEETIKKIVEIRRKRNNYNHTQETKDKISKSKKGFKHSEEAKQHLSKVCSGWKQTEEAKKRISEANKGVIRTKEHRNKISKSLIGRKVPQEITTKCIITRLENGSGYTKNGYCGAFVDREYKDSIRERDGYTCQDCGMSQEYSLNKWKRLLSIHHIDGDKLNSHYNNLITLCVRCHCKADWELKKKRKV